MFFYLVGAHLLGVRSLLFDGLDMELLAVHDSGFATGGATCHEPLVDALGHGLSLFLLVLEGLELLLLEPLLPRHLLSHEVILRSRSLHKQRPPHITIISSLMCTSQVSRLRQNLR